MAQSKYSYSEEIKEVEDDTFEWTKDFDERSNRFYDFDYENASVQGLIPMDSTLNYFECEIISEGETGYGIRVGIGPWSDLDENSHPRTSSDLGVFCDASTGCIYVSRFYLGQDSESQGGKVETGSTFSTGDRIGCGIDFQAESDGDVDHHADFHVFITKNGKQIGNRIRCVMPPFRICPMIAMGQRGQRVRFLQHCSRPSLLSVVQKCDTDVLRTLLPLECSGAPSHDSDDSTLIVAFHEACSLGFADVVQTFLECTGESDDLLAKKGLNALQIATMNKRSLVVQILLKSDSFKRAHRERDKDGCTPLLIAAKCGDQDTFSCLLEHMSQLVDAGDAKQDTARIKDTDTACRSIVTETAAEYEQEMDVFSADVSSEAAVTLEMKPLKSKGSSQDVQETDSEIRITFPPEDNSKKEVSQSEFKTIEELKIQYQDIFTEVNNKSLKNVMHLAAENGHGNIIKLLWSQSYSKEVFVALMTRNDKDGNTPFHLCCKNGHVSVVQEFLAILDEDGVIEQANRYVQKEGHKEESYFHMEDNLSEYSLCILPDHEVTYFDLLNMEDDNAPEYSLGLPAGYSPMHLACLHGHEEVFKLLQSSKHSNKHIMNRYRQTLLHIAAAGGYTQIIEMLIGAEANVIAKDANHRTPLHCAAKNGRVVAVKRLMEVAYDQANKKAESADKKVAKNVGRSRAKGKKWNAGIFGKDGDSDEEDNDLEQGPTYLDEAILFGQREVVDVIISCDKLDDITYSGGTLYLLIKQMPDAAKNLLDGCIKPVNWDTDYYKETCEVKFDYDLLKRRLGKIPERKLFPTLRDELETKQSQRKMTYGWKSFLTSLSKSKEENLIKHPIVEGFVHNVWKQKYRWIYYSTLLLHVIFVAMLTCLALLLNNPTSSTCQLILSGQFSIPTVEDEVNISQIPDRSREVVVDYFMTNNFTLTDNLTNVSSGSLCSSEAAQIRDVLTTYTSLEIFCVPECGISNRILMFIRALAVMLIIISSVKIVSELGQLLHGCCEPRKNGHQKHWWLYFYYLADLANWLELPLYIFTIIFASSQLNSECTCIQTWQWSIGITALFLAWASLILFLRKLDLFDTGIYVLMFEILIRRFLKTIILTSLLVVMFALTFFLTFNQINPSFARSPFSSAFTSLWKMMTMITGEMDYESIFRQSSSGTLDPDPPLPFPEISYVLWIVFLVLIPILLGNLLTGLAVDDVKEILSTAEVRKLKSKMELIVSMNDLIFIWVALLLYTLLPLIIILVFLFVCFFACFICPCCICYIAYGVYNGRDDEDIMNKFITWYFSFFEYLFKEGEPQISTITVHPFKLRSPLSASKHYKSPENLAKIIKKSPPEENIQDSLKVMGTALMEKMESCLKEEVEKCLEEKLQQRILEEMTNHFKLMEDNVVKKMEQMMETFKHEKVAMRIRENASLIDEGKDE